MSTVVINSVIIGGEEEHQRLELKDKGRFEEQQLQQHHITRNEQIVVDVQFSTATKTLSTSSSAAAALLTANEVESYPPSEEEQITASRLPS